MGKAILLLLLLAAVVTALIIQLRSMFMDTS